MTRIWCDVERCRRFAVLIAVGDCTCTQRLCQHHADQWGNHPQGRCVQCGKRRRVVAWVSA